MDSQDTCDAIRLFLGNRTDISSTITGESAKSSTLHLLYMYSILQVGKVCTLKEMKFSLLSYQFLAPGVVILVMTIHIPYWKFNTESGCLSMWPLMCVCTCMKSSNNCKIHQIKHLARVIKRIHSLPNGTRYSLSISQLAEVW